MAAYLAEGALTASHRNTKFAQDKQGVLCEMRFLATFAQWRAAVDDGERFHALVIGLRGVCLQSA